jgi:hypothetical protein
VIDIGLEGKILASAFVSAAVAFTTQNPWYGVLAGMLVSVLLACCRPTSPSRRKATSWWPASPSTSP